MRLTFYGAARTVTGSKYLLDTGSKRLLIDCGLFQGEAKDEEHWNALPFDPNEIDYAVITHGHLDHVGLLPLIVKDGGWRGRVLSTPATRDVSGFILRDSAKQARRAYGRADALAYDENDVEKVMQQWSTVVYEKPYDLGDGITIRFFEAGHILGSSSVEVVIARNGTKKTLVFSGDLGRPNTPILRDPAKIPGADLTLIESTYGDRLHDNAKNSDRLRDVVKEIAANKGRLLIPAFAIGRTQSLLWELDRLLTAGQIPKVPVFVDSPLGTNITNVYRRHEDCFDDETKQLLAKGDSVFDFPTLTETKSVQQSMQIDHTAPPAVIIAGSGMMNGGRILGHLEHFIGDPHTTVLVVGYQAEGTLGRKLLEGAKEARIDNQTYPVRAKVQTINGFSAHADRDELCTWFGNFGRKPDSVFVVHGEGRVADSFAGTLKTRFSIPSIAAPKLGDSVEI